MIIDVSVPKSLFFRIYYVRYGNLSCEIWPFPSGDFYSYSCLCYKLLPQAPSSETFQSLDKSIVGLGDSSMLPSESENYTTRWCIGLGNLKFIL